MQSWNSTVHVILFVIGLAGSLTCMVLFEWLAIRHHQEKRRPIPHLLDIFGLWLGGSTLADKRKEAYYRRRMTWLLASFLIFGTTTVLFQPGGID